MSADDSAADVTIARFDELEAFHHGTFRRLRAGLGARAFGMQIVTLPAHSDVYPEHHHTDIGQEEIYVALSGRARMRIGELDHELEPGVFFRIGPREVRKVTTDAEPVQFVVVGGVPGRVFEPQLYTELGGVVAVVSARPLAVPAGEAVRLDGSASHAATSTECLTFSWDPEGTGSFVEGGPTLVHRYDAPGTYRATLSVVTTGDRWDTSSVVIRVG
jgi:quercetin dioxygenase-like cupin family protein